MRLRDFLRFSRLRVLLVLVLLLSPAQALTGKQGVNLLIAESLGIPLGMMGGALGGAAWGFVIGAMVPEDDSRHSTDGSEAAENFYWPPEVMGAVLGLYVGFGIGGVIGQSAGVSVGAKMQDLRAGFWPTVLATAAGDALGFATAGILMMPLNAYPEQEWIAVAAVTAGLSVALAAPVLWIGHKNRTLRPSASLPPDAKRWSHMQLGMQATLLQF